MPHSDALSDPCARVEHPQLHEVEERVQYIISLMATKVWVTGKTWVELAEAWGVSRSAVANYSSEASRRLANHGEREVVMALLQNEAARRIIVADNKEFPGIARLWADTVGGFSQKHEVDVIVTERGYPELIRSVVAELAQAGKLELLVRALLEREDARALLTEGEAIDG